MKGKKRILASALLVALSVAASPLQAQRGFGGGKADFRGPRGPNAGNAVDVALENLEALELNQDQLGQFQELKAILDGQVAGLVEEMRSLRESIRAGEVDRDEGVRQFEALRGELITASAPLRGRVQEILTVEQHNKLQLLVRQGRPGAGRIGNARAGMGFGPGGRRMGIHAQRPGFNGAFGAPGRPGFGGPGILPQAGPRGMMSRPLSGGRGGAGGYFQRGPGGEEPMSREGGWNLP